MVYKDTESAFSRLLVDKKKKIVMMTNEKKCKYCNLTTMTSLSDFHEIGWEAVSFNGREAVCACPKHCKQLEKDMQNSLVRSSVESEALW